MFDELIISVSCGFGLRCELVAPRARHVGRILISLVRLVTSDIAGLMVLLFSSEL